MTNDKEKLFLIKVFNNNRTYLPLHHYDFTILKIFEYENNNTILLYKEFEIENYIYEKIMYKLSKKERLLWDKTTFQKKIKLLKKYNNTIYKKLFSKEG